MPFPQLPPRLDPRERADRILHDVDVDRLKAHEKIALAEAYIRIAQVDEDRVANILNALLDADLSDFDKVILRATLRRRLRVLPLVTQDGQNRNGGN